MNYSQYNKGCLITSFLMLLLLIFKYKEIDLCIILILGSIFSILWRSIKIIYGKDKIEKNNEGKLSKLNKNWKTLKNVMC